jgi:hypothetical protein
LPVDDTFMMGVPFAITMKSELWIASDPDNPSASFVVVDFRLDFSETVSFIGPGGETHSYEQPVPVSYYDVAAVQNPARQYPDLGSGSYCCTAAGS